MERNIVSCVVKSKLQQWGFVESDIQEERTFSSLRLDYSDCVELLHYCEKKLEKHIPKKDFEQIRTVGDFINLFC